MEYTRVFTPDEIADLLVLLLGVDDSSAAILEPSAGDGALVRAMQRRGLKNPIVAVEPNAVYASVLWGINRPGLHLIHEEFTLESLNKYGAGGPYRYIVANPPFESEQEPGEFTLWLKHVRLMLKLLEPGGTLVTIVPAGLQGKFGEKSRILFEATCRNDSNAQFIPIRNWYKPDEWPIQILRYERPAQVEFVVW